MNCFVVHATLWQTREAIGLFCLYFCNISNTTGRKLANDLEKMGTTANVREYKLERGHQGSPGWEGAEVV